MHFHYIRSKAYLIRGVGAGGKGAIAPLLFEWGGGGPRPSTSLQFTHYATTPLVSQDGWNVRFVVSMPPHFYLASYPSAHPGQ